MNHWKRSFTLTCLCAVLTAGSLAAAQEPRMAAAAQPQPHRCPWATPMLVATVSKRILN